MLNSDIPIETATHWGPPTRQACTYTTRRSRTNLRGRFCRPLPCLGAVPLVLQAKNRQENMFSLRLQACVFLPDVQVVQPSKRGRLPSAAKTAPPTPSRPSITTASLRQQAECRRVTFQSPVVIADPSSSTSEHLYTLSAAPSCRLVHLMCPRPGGEL
jgi:hypothetical protein